MSDPPPPKVAFHDEGELPDGLPPPLHQDALHYASNPTEVDQRMKFLTSVFEAFDKDGSGELNTRELQKLLKYVGVQADHSVVEGILDDIDVDEGGTIDMDEFLEFFQKVSDMSMMRLELEAEKSKHDNWGKLGRLYAVLNILGLFFFAIAYLGGDVTGDDATIILGGLVISAISLIVVVCAGLIMPIMSIHAGNSAHVNALKQRAEKAKQRLARNRTEDVNEIEENLKNKVRSEESQRKLPPPPSTMIDSGDAALPPSFHTYRQRLQQQRMSLREAGAVTDDGAAELNEDLESETDDQVSDLNMPDYKEEFGYDRRDYAAAKQLMERVPEEHYFCPWQQSGVKWAMPRSDLVLTHVRQTSWSGHHDGWRSDGKDTAMSPSRPVTEQGHMAGGQRQVGWGGQALALSNQGQRPSTMGGQRRVAW